MSNFVDFTEIGDEGEKQCYPFNLFKMDEFEKTGLSDFVYNDPQSDDEDASSILAKVQKPIQLYVFSFSGIVSRRMIFIPRNPEERLKEDNPLWSDPVYCGLYFGLLDYVIGEIGPGMLNKHILEGSKESRFVESAQRYIEHLDWLRSTGHEDCIQRYAFRLLKSAYPDAYPVEEIDKRLDSITTMAEQVIAQIKAEAVRITKEERAEG